MFIADMITISYQSVIVKKIFIGSGNFFLSSDNSCCGFDQNEVSSNQIGKCLKGAKKLC